MGLKLRLMGKCGCLEHQIGNKRQREESKWSCLFAGLNWPGSHCSGCVQCCVPPESAPFFNISTIRNGLLSGKHSQTAGYVFDSTLSAGIQNQTLNHFPECTYSMWEGKAILLTCDGGRNRVCMSTEVRDSRLPGGDKRKQLPGSNVKGKQVKGKAFEVETRAYVNHGDLRKPGTFRETSKQFSALEIESVVGEWEVRNCLKPQRLVKSTGRGPVPIQIYF